MSRLMTLILPAALLATGCSPQLVQVRVDEPAGAKMTVLEGVHTEAKSAMVPVTGRYEATSLSEDDAYNVTFDLDAAAAARYGASGPVTLYGKLCVGQPTRLGLSQTLVLRMPPEKISELIRGSRSEVEVFVEDKGAGVELTRLLLHMKPF
jgi:hypothetical protein